MKKNAFTLVEVLTTLAIIGVVAAITIPTFNTQAKNTNIVVAVKKYQSVLNNVIDAVAIENKCIGDYSECGLFDGVGVDLKLGNAVKHHFNVVKDCGVEAGKGCFPKGVRYKRVNPAYNWFVVDNGGAYKLKLADGASIFFYDYPGNCTYNGGKPGVKCPQSLTCGWILVDVNGNKKPNQQGRDTFGWYITRTGVKAMGSSYDKFSMPNGEPACDPTSTNMSTIPHAGRGYGCTAKVIQENAMNY